MFRDSIVGMTRVAQRRNQAEETISAKTSIDAISQPLFIENSVVGWADQFPGMPAPTCQYSDDGNANRFMH